MAEPRFVLDVRGESERMEVEEEAEEHMKMKVNSGRRASCRKEFSLPPPASFKIQS
jgi:hypothetical protein